MKKLLIWAAASFVAVTAAVCIWLLTWDSGGFKSYDITLRNDYQITRDAYGVPLIHGATDADVAYGVALAHSEDDFETIQLTLLGVKRRLGSVYGKEGAKLDFLSYVLRVEEVVDAHYDSDLSPAIKDFVTAYADGINRFAQENPGRVLRKDVFPISGKDIVGGFVLSSPLFFGLDDAIGALVEGKEINPPPAVINPAVINKGSNGIVVAPSRSSDGLTRLVSNSHQPWNGPVAWYELRVESDEGWRYYGAGFPGSPIPFVGHNDNLGWTSTVNRPDLVDIYQLTLDKSGKNYKFGEEWRPLEVTKVLLRVKMGPFTLPITQKLYRSVHGPVFINKNGAFALRYPGMEEVRHIEQYLAMARAANFDEWVTAMQMQAIPATNMIYADRAGNIALLYNAAFPNRPSGYDWWRILPGDDPKAVWEGILPFDSQPFLVNPPAGYIVNSNNTPFLATAAEDNLNPDDFTDNPAIEPFVTNRITRALALFAADDSTSREDLNRIKYDTGYDKSSPFGKLMTQVITLQSDNAETQQGIALMQQWDWSQDGVGAADSLAALLLLELRAAGYQVAEVPDLEQVMAEKVAYLKHHFGRIDPPLADILRLRKGDIDLPVTGGPDALRAILWEEEADGTLTANFGDSFVMFVEWDKDGVVSSRSIQPFGANVQDEASPHYNDQSQMFVDFQTKDTGFVTSTPRAHMTD